MVVVVGAQLTEVCSYLTKFIWESRTKQIELLIYWDSDSAIETVMELVMNDIGVIQC